MFHFRPILPRILLFFWLLLLLSACTPSAVPRHDFSYAETAFSVSVRGTYTLPDGTARPIAAAVSLGEPADGSHLLDRPMTLTFTQPSALEGLTIQSAWQAGEGGEPSRTVTLTYPTAYGTSRDTAHSAVYAGFLRFAEALLPAGDITEVSPKAEDGTHTVTRRTADGAREAVFWFSEDRELPLRVKVTAGGETIELVLDPLTP
jgi:hypothetical protein